MNVYMHAHVPVPHTDLLSLRASPVWFSKLENGNSNEEDPKVRLSSHSRLPGQHVWVC